jgi:hypothetical protein
MAPSPLQSAPLRHGVISLTGALLFLASNAARATASVYG